MKKKNLFKTAIPGFLLLSAPAVSQAAFTAGNLVVVTVGGSASINLAQTVTLNEYNISGPTFPATAIPHVMPSSGSLSFSLSGANDHDGLLRLSENGQYLTIGGYRADAGALDPRLSTAAQVNRVIGVIDGNWNIDTSTALTDAYDNTTIRAVSATSTLSFYTFGAGNYVDLNTGNTISTISGGLRYVDHVGSTVSTNLSQTQALNATLQPDDIRGGLIAGNQVYITTGSGSSYPEKGAYKTHTALPTSGAQAMDGVMTSSDTDVTHTGSDDTNVPKSDMVLLDLNLNIPGYDTAYTTGGKKEYEKWSLVEETPGHYDWQRTSLKTSATAKDINALDATISGFTNAGVPIVDLFAATESGVYKITDNTGYNSVFNTAFGSTSLVPTPASGNLRGIVILGAVHVVPEPVELSIAGVAGAIAFLRRRRNSERTTW